MKNWLQNVYFPNTGNKSLTLLDYWSGYRPEVISEVTLSNTDFKHLSIPQGQQAKYGPLYLVLKYGKVLLEGFLIRLFFTNTMSIYTSGIIFLNCNS